jgi:hypothetical protein
LISNKPSKADSLSTYLLISQCTNTQEDVKMIQRIPKRCSSIQLNPLSSW